jgi:D-aminoacyl-tRNA deacylase
MRVIVAEVHDERVRAVVQCVSSASVVVDDTVVGALEEPGLLVYLGIAHTDGVSEVDWMARKVWGLRILRDEQSASDLGAPVLVVSQFTLYGDAAKGRRPSFVDAARPEVAVPLYERFLALLRARGASVETGEFGAMMDVELVNDGPVTLWLER